MPFSMFSIRDDDLVLRLQERLEHVEDRVLASAGDEDLLAGVRETIVPLQLGRHGIFQFVDPAGGGVLGEALADGLDGRLFDVLGR